jgi:hypothetical protein
MLAVTDRPKKFLFIDFKLSEQDRWQSTMLKISEEGSTAVIQVCKYDGYDSCYIPKALIRDNTNLFVTVQCQDACKYSLKSKWSDLEHLKPGDDYIFKFGS